MRIDAVARTVAVSIACAAIIDPTATRTVPRAPRTSIVVVESPTLDLPVSRTDARTRRVVALDTARRLADIVPGARLDPVPTSDADGVIAIGDSLVALPSMPAGAEVVTVSVGEPLAPNISVDAFDVPARAAVGDRVEVSVTVSNAGVAGTRTTLSLIAGTLTVAQRAITWSAGAPRVRLSFEFVPWQPGPLPLRVVASHDGPQVTPLDDHADAGVMVEDRRVRVLVLDATPSWISRFVTHALEDSPSFVVSSRVGLGRGATARSGADADTPIGATPQDDVDVVLVSNLAAESPAVLDWLDAFMRVRGGAVVALADETGDLAPVTRWWPVQLQAEALAEPTVFAFDQHPELRVKAADVARVRRLPAASRIVASSGAAPAQPGIVAHPVGLGTLVVNLAFDAWHFRADDDRAFARAWSGLVHALGRRAARPLELTAPPVVRPGQALRVTARVRPSPSIDATTLPALAMGDRNEALWPQSADGHYTATIPGVGPGEPSPFVVSIGALQTEGAVITRPDARVVTSTLPLSWLATAHHGLATHATDAISRVPAWLAGRVKPAGVETVTWRPMRSPWWIVAFVGALGVEWFVRRRAGQR